MSHNAQHTTYRKPFFTHYSSRSTHCTTAHSTPAIANNPQIILYELSANHLTPFIRHQKMPDLATFIIHTPIIPLISHHSSRSTHPTTIHHTTTHHTTLKKALISYDSSNNAHHKMPALATFILQALITPVTSHHPSRNHPPETNHCKQSPRTIHLILIITEHSLHNHSFYTTHHTVFITQPLNSHPSSQITRQTPLISHYSSHSAHHATAQLTPRISQPETHITHITPISTHHFSYHSS